MNRHNLDEKKHNDESVPGIHAVTTGHRFNFEGTKIIFYENNTKNTPTEGGVEIKKRNSSINYMCDSSNLRSAYKSLFNHIM